jgi:hypothetical protein
LDPWRRVCELLRQYRVSICTVETLPNADSARQLQADPEFVGKVYLAKYSGAVDADLVAWGDQQSRSDRKTLDTMRERYACTLNQFKAMQAALFRVKGRGLLIPDPALLQQPILERNEWRQSLICKDMFFEHLCKTALVVETDPVTRKNRPRVQKVGIDPHFAYSYMLATISYARNANTTSWFLPGEGIAAAPVPPLAERVQVHMKGLPTAVLHMLDEAERPGTCARCIEYTPAPGSASGLCQIRCLTVAPGMPSCDLYIPAG